MRAWLPKAGPYKIERMPMPHPLGEIDLSKPPAGVMHTIEGSLRSGLSVFKQHYTPTFGVGHGRIIQFTPLGLMDAALENHYGGSETNRWARVQIEVEGYSQEHPYLFSDAVVDPLAELMAALVDEVGIPLSRPYPDAMPRPPWATEKFARRRDGKWGRTPGWFGHVEIPENSHWDPGALQWERLLAIARGKRPKTAKRKTSHTYAIKVTTEDGKTKTWKSKTPGTALAHYGVAKHKVVHAEITRV